MEAKNVNSFFVEHKPLPCAAVLSHCSELTAKNAEVFYDLRSILLEVAVL